jgi:hypothetical protein
MGAHQDLIAGQGHHRRRRHCRDRNDGTDVVELASQIRHDRLGGVGIASWAVQEQVELALLRVGARFHEAAHVAQLHLQHPRLHRPALHPSRGVHDDRPSGVLAQLAELPAPDHIVDRCSARKRMLPLLLLGELVQLAA